MTTRLAIVCTHPIQYHAPAFGRLAATAGLEVKVFYEWEGPVTLDKEFGRSVVWDTPLLDGYEHEFVRNVSRDPGTHHFRGIDNPTLVKEISAWEPDVLLVYGWAFESHLRALMHFGGTVPVLFRGDSTLLDERRGLKTLMRRVALRWVYSHVDVALFAGTNNEAYFRAHGLRDDQLIWAPHAVDLEHFSQLSAQREAEARRWRETLGISEKDIVFLYAGKLSSRKGIEDLMSVFCGLPPQSHNRRAHLVLAGDGELSDLLKRLSAGRSDVHFLGFQNQTSMPVIYRIGDVLVLPSRYGETWGLAVNEAMACGRPAIVSDKVGCAIDLVLPLKTGIVFSRSDQGSLTRAMLQLLREPKVIAPMGSTAHARIQGWSISAFAGVVLHACNRLRNKPALMPAEATTR